MRNTIARNADGGSKQEEEGNGDVDDAQHENEDPTSSREKVRRFLFRYRGGLDRKGRWTCLRHLTTRFYIE